MLVVKLSLCTAVRRNVTEPVPCGVPGNCSCPTRAATHPQLHDDYGYDVDAYALGLHRGSPAGFGCSGATAHSVQLGNASGAASKRPPHAYARHARAGRWVQLVRLCDRFKDPPWNGGVLLWREYLCTAATPPALVVFEMVTGRTMSYREVKCALHSQYLEAII
jgi:hypothetical protein